MGGSMIDVVKDYVKTLFEEGKIKGFLALRSHEGNIVPHLYNPPADVLDGFNLGDSQEAGDARYPLASIMMTILSEDPDGAYGMLVRGCDDRALNELLRWNQINAPERLIRVGIACPSELALSHECRRPFPNKFIAGEKATPASYVSVQEIQNKALGSRLEYWLKEFDRCIKCYGCRNVCPVCFCNVCTLEQEALIKTGQLPPENPMFHLTRAVHMAGRCIDCNLCTEVCPAEIPLRTLYKGVAKIIEEEFGYLTGIEGEGKSPLNFLGPDPGHTSANG